MKINEKLHYDDLTDTLVVQETYDPNPILNSVAQLKSAGYTGFSENRHVARVPTFLIEQWCKEAGVSFSNQEAVKEILHKKILSGDFNNLRPWTGTY